MIGDGGVFTSIEDLVHWVNALNYDTLDEGLTAMLETRGILNTGDTIRYAFGQTHGQYRGLRTVGHGGAFVGFRADITRFPDRDTSFLTICNRSDVSPSRLARRVADVVLADYLGSLPAAQNRSDSATTPTPDPGPVTNVDDYVGSYYSPELDVEYRLSRNEEALRLRVGQGIDGELRRAEEDVFVLGRFTLRFTRESGRVTGFEVDAGRVQHVAFIRGESGR